MSTNFEGSKGPNLTDAKKRRCTRCNGTFFQTEATTGNAGAGEGIYFLCRTCGYEELITLLALGATQNYT